MENLDIGYENNLPGGNPSFGLRENFDDAIGIAIVHHASAWEVNQETKLVKHDVQTSSSFGDGATVNSCHFLLPRKTTDPLYRFGRWSAKGSREFNLDVYIPESRVAIRQFTLFPDPIVNFWRIEANSETITRVNGVPLQVVDTRTKTYKNRLPHLVYLDPNIPNKVVVSNVEITIWLLRTPREALGASSNLLMSPLDPQVQDIVSQQTDWARSRWILGKDAVEVSNQSEKVLERFNGSFFTAKLFRDSTRGRDRRDLEFQVMNRPIVDESIVKYLCMTEIRGIPSIITSTHDGFIPYAICHEHISTWHPGVRFQVATQILRRLLTAVGFLHFNGILHRSLGQESVLLRLADDKVEQILVVDYGRAQNVIPGHSLPRKSAVEDGQAIMELAVQCCDIWELRNGPPPDAISDEEMAQRTRTAADGYEKVRRVMAHFLQNEKGDPKSERGQNLATMLDFKKYELRHARDDQTFNARRRVIRPLTRNKINEFKEDWEKRHAVSEDQPPMILSLGHSYLDELVNKIYQEDWDATPQEICRQLQHLEGDCKEHWRLLTISKTLAFPLRPGVKSGGQQIFISGEAFADYLAFCIEMYPKSRHTLCSAYRKHLQPNSRGSLRLKDIKEFTAELAQSQAVPRHVVASLQKLQLVTDEDKWILTEQHKIWSHIPSRAFNLTQLQRLASPSYLKTCICNDVVPCDNFVEVKGGPDVQGCYAPLSLLPAFAQAFDLTIHMGPQEDISKPIYDPSDFFQANNNGRLILARRGLVGYASICRTADQITHCPKDVSDIQSAVTFLPTYFGDIEVLPQSSDRSFNFPQPAHWSLFKPTEPSELDLYPTELDTAIGKLLVQRKKLRAEAVPPPPKQSTGGDSPPPKRFKSSQSLSQGLSRLGATGPSFRFPSLAQRLNLDPVQQSFTEVASSAGYDEDREAVEKMMEKLPDIANGSNALVPMFGFERHDASHSNPTNEMPDDEKESSPTHLPANLNLASTLVVTTSNKGPPFASSALPKLNTDAAVQTSFLQPAFREHDLAEVPDTEEPADWNFVNQPQISEAAAAVRGSSGNQNNISIADTGHQSWVEVDGARTSDAENALQESGQKNDESLPDTDSCNWDNVEHGNNTQAEPDVAQELAPSNGEPMSED